MTWPPIVFPESGLPDDCATVGMITYRNGQSGTLVYGRYQPCNECSGPLQAYAKTSPPFPYYSTGDQVLEAYELEMLLQLGEHVGQRMCAIASQIPGYADIGRVRALPDAVPEVADSG